MSSTVRDPLGDPRFVEARGGAGRGAPRAWPLEPRVRRPAAGCEVWRHHRGRVPDRHRGPPPERLKAGDVFLLSGPPPYVMASDLETPHQSATQVLHRTKNKIVRLGSRRAKPVTHALGGRFKLDPANAHLLVEALPVCLRIPANEASSLRGVTRLLIDELRSAQLGRVRALDQLAQLTLTYALRWLDPQGRSPARAGLLRALADPRLGAALRHLHTSVDRGTSLAELARLAGMSRTAFAARFKELVGQPPLAYALQWRMSLAKDALRRTDRAIGALAFDFGYASESAFSLAFRREVGCSPRAYRAQDAARRTG